MTVKEVITAKKTSLSFEVFPPKTSSDFDSVLYAVEEIAKQIQDNISYIIK